MGPMTTRNRRRSSAEGFSLLEVIIATAGVSTAYATFCGCAAIAWITLGFIPYRQVRNNRAILDVTAPLQLWSDLKAEGLMREDAPTG